jgi:hypothetical protein
MQLVLPKKDRKAYIFRIFKFFIDPNKVSPLKTGIESKNVPLESERYGLTNKVSPLKTGIERIENITDCKADKVLTIHVP